MTVGFTIIPYLQESHASETMFVQRRQLACEYPVHGHDYFEMELILEGNGVQWANDNEIPLLEGSLYLLSPSDYHRIQPDRPITLLSFHFLPDSMPGWQEPIREACFAQLDARDFSLFSSLAVPLDDPGAAHTPSYFQRLHAVILYFLAHLQQNGIRYPLSKPGRRLQQALKYIQARHADPLLRLSDAADFCGLSACYFSSLFSQTVGCGFSDYLTECRLQHACTLLNMSSMPVTEIALEAGFSSMPHFYRMFRRKYGCPPGVFREQNSSAEASTSERRQS